MGNTIVGIDLGTTNSAIAVAKNGEAQVIKNVESQDTTPSVVFFAGVDDGGNDEYLVGSQAKNAAATSPKDVIQFIKRQMGNEKFSYESPSGKTYTPEMVSALILKKLCMDAELYLGEGTIKDVVITVPAYFDDARRTATKQAGEIAGLNVLRVINEPTAAAISFGIDTSENGKVLVYDLGGGTFDVTLMDIDGGSFDVLATNGSHELGGINFDQKIVDLILKDLESQGCEIDYEDDMFTAEIREKAELAKIQLTNVAQVNHIKFTINEKNYDLKISRESFEEASKPLLDQTGLILEEVLNTQKLTWDQIDHLLMVGGSTKMPMVKKMLEGVSGKTLTRTVNPDLVVAMGAALFASTLTVGDAASAESGAEDGAIPGGITVSDVTSQSLGVIALNEFNNEYNSVIIPHDTKIPAKKSGTYSTVRDNQTAIDVRVTEGNDKELEFVKVVGSSTLTLPAYPKGSPVEIIYAYDIDQTIFIEVIDLVTNQSLGTFDIDRSSNLDETQVQEATKLIGSTKVD